MSFEEDQFDELFKKIWKKFNEVFSDMKKVDIELPSWDVKSSCIEPLINIFEEGDDIIITADLPKVEKEDITINADIESVKITANFKEKLKLEKWGTIQKQNDLCRFFKVIKLSHKIKPEEAKAEFKKGILVVRLPKKKEVFTVKIE